MEGSMMTQPDDWHSPYDPQQGASPAPPQQPYQPYQAQQPYQPYQAQPYQPQQPYPPHVGAPYGYVPPPPKNALGVWSLVLGIMSLVLLFSCFVGILAAVPAVITGHLSRKAQRAGLANNEGLALGGIVTGWITIGLTLLVMVGFGAVFAIPSFWAGLVD